MAETIPVTGVLVREGEMTGDGRMFEPGAVRWDSEVLPIPIIFDRDDGDHSGATVGRIETVWREGSDIHGMGVLSGSDDPDTQSLVARAAELLTEGAVGVSIGADSTRGNVKIDLSFFDDITEEDGVVTVPVAYDQAVRTFTEARLRHLAIVDTAAFATAFLSVDSAQTGALVAAGSINFTHFFESPAFGVAGQDQRLRYDPGTGKWSCPPTLQGDHYFGHVAPDGICLRGQPGRCITPPNANLEGFMRHYAPAAGGLRTGVVQLAGSHADVGSGVMAAQKHYDNTGVAVADVRVGRDAYGVWFSGMVRPGVTKNDRYALAASDVSGHWEQEQNGTMALVGLPAVNVGGYPKGYLTAQEVASGIAASASIKDAEAPMHITMSREEMDRVAPVAMADCGCATEVVGEVIPLETILSFHDKP